MTPVTQLPGALDCYKLPPGNVVVAFSGGRTSAYMLRMLVEANGLDVINSDRVVVAFQNTGREMPETLNFVQDCADFWGVNIIWLEYRLRWTGAPHDVRAKVFDTGAHSFEVVTHNSASRDGRPMTELLEYYGFIPTALSRWCTGRLKVKTSAAYLKSQGWTGWTAATGIRADEGRRATQQGKKIERGTMWHPLYNAGVTKEDVAAFWASQPFDLRLPNINGRTPAGNCDGCFLKSEANRAALARDFPDRAQWWADLEKKYAGSRQRLGKGGVADTFNKKGSWEDLIKMVQDQGHWRFNTEDGLCQKDDGECFG